MERNEQARRRRLVPRQKSGRERSRRQPPEKAPRQPAAVVKDDSRSAMVRHFVAVWNHSNHNLL
jgi:hypothetical protein